MIRRPMPGVSNVDGGRANTASGIPPGDTNCLVNIADFMFVQGDVPTLTAYMIAADQHDACCSMLRPRPTAAHRIEL
ncbi:hypothetical protein CABS01_16884 [Colletotrichum abscissum]|uniref:uncharacterized protein n=1 Tax=Colletotrichum abscissum TaxID=1671311 RepID=UPI0027D6FD08|nr:uncharacterized protein CABS01_16884 [Colletotrichum abscissum]KAK1507968.1 hypothetical protein CABS01_16884 [Colletotrichum abscissum]